MASKSVRIGQIYHEARPPRRRWRVVELRGDLAVVERADNPNIRRFPEAKTLLDPEHYLVGEE